MIQNVDDASRLPTVQLIISVVQTKKCIEKEIVNSKQPVEINKCCNNSYNSFNILQ